MIAASAMARPGSNRRDMSEIQPTKIRLRRLNFKAAMVSEVNPSQHRSDRVWAIVVARVGDGAKSRLSTVLSPSQRRTLALVMLSDVVEVALRAGLDGVLAVVDEPEALARVQQLGAIGVLDTAAGMNAAASRGIEEAQRRGATTAIVLPGDVPRVTPNDLRLMYEAAGSSERAVIVGADRERLGTNALLLRPPAVMAPAFGPPSVQRHVRLGRAAAGLVQVLADLGLSRDVDTPSDLASLDADDDGLGRRTAEALSAFAAGVPVG
jgi:2-phospho-L-lactate guanylyltransferase